MGFLTYLKNLIKRPQSRAPYVISSIERSAPGASLPPLGPPVTPSPAHTTPDLPIFSRVNATPSSSQVYHSLQDSNPLFPPTYKPIVDDARVQQPKVYDPALRHYAHGFRAGEPAFFDPKVALAWRAARHRASHHILALISSLPIHDNLILRGSTLLAAWFGDHARSPGDIDLVVRPATLKHDSLQGKAIVSDLIKAVQIQPYAQDIAFDPTQTTQTDIWLYERAPGRRIVFTWKCADLPSGQVQVDIVYEEQMPGDPQLTRIHPPGQGTDIELWSATRELSLAWKLLWLATDIHPQGKDVYDAVLLAESIRMDPSLLKEVFTIAGEDLHDPPTAGITLMNLETGWEHFNAEYPHISGDAAHWLDRLNKATAN